METVTWDVAVHTAYQARMGLGMAENHQTGTRPNDDAVVICRGMRQSVVKALTSESGQLRTLRAALGFVRFWGMSRPRIQATGLPSLARRRLRDSAEFDVERT